VASLPRLSTLACALLILACKSSQGTLDGGIPDAAPVLVADVASVEAPAADGQATVADASVSDASVDAAPAIDTAAGPDAAAGPCSSNLAGTWDLIAAAPGAGFHSGVLVLDRDAFSLTVAGKQLTYSLTDRRAIWQGGRGPHVVTIQNTPGAVTAGALPLSVGGFWTFDGQTEHCELVVAPGAVGGKCSTRSPTGDSLVGGSDWPGSVPSPRNGRSYQATQTAVLPSRFGGLGGRWEASADQGSPARCQATIDGNETTFVCHEAGFFDGTTRLTIGDDCIASGTSSGGFELSARRR